VFVAVTRRQLICYRLKFGDGWPDRLLLAVPLAAGSFKRRRWSVTYTGPDGKVFRFSVLPSWTRDFAELATALKASRTAVESASAVRR
jgi:hypothetical protein